MREPSSSSSNGPGFGTRLVRAFRNIVIFSLVVGLAGAALYASALLNSKTYMLEVREGKLVVLKGRMMPTGAEPWMPADSTLADAYAPFDLEGNTSLSVTGVKFGERDELDRAMFTVIELIAKPRVSSDAPKDLEQGLALLRRGEKLNGLSEEQKLSLKKMRSEVAFYLAKTRLEDARKQLESAVSDLKLSADADAKHHKEATQMLLIVEPQVKQLSDSVRAAINGLPAPVVAPPAPAVAPIVPVAPPVAPVPAGDVDSTTKTRTEKTEKTNLEPPF